MKAEPVQIGEVFQCIDWNGFKMVPRDLQGPQAVLAGPTIGQTKGPVMFSLIWLVFLRHVSSVCGT